MDQLNIPVYQHTPASTLEHLYGRVERQLWIEVGRLAHDDGRDVCRRGLVGFHFVGFHSSPLRLFDLVFSVRLHVQPIWRIVKTIDDDADHDEDGDDHNDQNRFNAVHHYEFLIV